MGEADVIKVDRAYDTPAGTTVTGIDTHLSNALTIDVSDQAPTGFRPDAKVWDLYLDLAEAEAKERAALWNTSLDSLLIFAGLFAGVVSSFVIDARSDLQTDSIQRSLVGLLDFSRSGSVVDILSIPVSAYWISGLWVVSLCATLFSAVMAILGKAWLAKYIMAFPRRRAKDAYRRYRLDAEARRWHAKVTLVLPLLVQVASFLFVVGLIIQLHGDSPTIGRILLSFAILGLGLYMAMTCLPFLAPSTPISTPLSDLLSALFPVDSGTDEQRTFATGMDAVLCEILYGKLIMSEKAEIIDVAIAEIALPQFAHYWAYILWKTETPRVLLWRMRHYATTTMSDLARQQETLSNHLSLFIAFTEVYETELTNVMMNASWLENIPLHDAMRKLLSYGHPAHRLHYLPKGCWPLLLRLRVHLLLLPSLSSSVADLDAEEYQHRPWEMIHSDLHSGHRIHVSLASCRGLLQGGERLKSISGFILCMSLGKAALVASETGRTSEWAKDLDDDKREKVNILALRYTSRLYHATVSGWDGLGVEAFREAYPDDLPLGETSGVWERSGILGFLILSLSQNPALRVHAIKMLQHVSSRLTLSVLPSHAAVRSVAMMTVYNDQGLREDGLKLLINLMKVNEPLSELVRSALVTSMQSGLSKSEGQPRLTIQFVEKLSMLQYPDNLFASCISDVIPNLVDLFMNNSAPGHVRQAALKLSQRLWLVNLFSEVKSAILDHLGVMLERDEFNNRYDFFNNVQTLVKARDFASGKERPAYTFPWYSPADFIIDIMSNVFGKVVKVAIYEEDRTISVGAQDFLKSLAKNDRFNRYLPNLEIMTWLEAVTVRPSRWRVRHNAVLVVETFSKQLIATADLLNILVEAALTDDDDDVRTAAIKLVSDLWKQPYAIDYDIAQEVKKTIISDSHKDTIQNEVYTDIREKWVLFLGEVAEYVAFSEAIPVIIQVAVARGSSSEFRSKAVALLVSESLTKGTDYCEVVKATVPDDLEVQLPCTSDLFSKGKWIKLLIELLPHLELQDVAQVALAKVVSSVKESLDPKSDPKPPPSADQAEGENSGETPEVSSDDSDFLTESDIAPPLRRLLGKSSWDGRMYWVEILASLAEHFPEDFPDAPKIVLQIAMHDPDGDVRNMALQSLRPLAKRDTIRDSFLNVVVDRMDSMADDGDWNVRFALAQLLAAFGESKECKLPEQATSRLTTMALDDRDYDVRSESVNSLAVLLANDGQYPEVSTAVLEKFEAGVKDGHWKPRQSWMKLIPPHIKDAGSARVNLVFDIAINDDDVDVRKAAIGVLEQLLGDAKLGDEVASKIGKSLPPALKNDKQQSNAMSLLTRLTIPKPREGRGIYEDAETALAAGHETWIGVTTLLSRNNFQGVPKIVEMAIKDMPDDNYVDLKSLFGKVKLQDPIQNVLPKYLESALKSDSNDIRSQAVTLFDRLLCSEDSLAWDYGGLLGRTNDAQLISRLAEMVVKDEEYTYHLRKRSLKLLKNLFTDFRFQDHIRSSLSKAIESCLKEPDLMKFRTNALVALHSLTDANDDPSDLNRFEGVVLPSMSHLLRIALVPTDRDSEAIRKEAEDILLENLASYRDETKISRGILLAIPEMIPTLTAGGTRTALQLAETLHVGDDAAVEIIGALAPHLRATSSVSRATALELLSRFFLKPGLPISKLFEFAVPEIVTLALEDDVVEIRMTAIKLLVSFYAVAKSTEQGCSTTAPTGSPALKQITLSVAKFMGLLQDEKLRPEAVELLSLMSTDPAVRRRISLQVIALAFGADNTTLQFQAHFELLLRLISDGRFGNEPLDKVMLLLGSALSTRPTLASYRFQVLTALWCRYGPNQIVPAHRDDGSGSSKRLDGLVGWFTFAMFGRHATTEEVRTWLEKCAAWLPEEPKPEDEQYTDHSRAHHSAIEEELQSSSERRYAPLPELAHNGEDILEPTRRVAASSGSNYVCPSPAQGDGEHDEAEVAPGLDGSIRSRRSSVRDAAATWWENLGVRTAEP